jgi:hypothetical protein
VARKTVLAALAAAALAAAGCGTKQEPARSGQAARPPAVYAVGAKVFGLGGRPVHLAAPPVAPLAGWLTPVAVPSPEGGQLAYSVWRELRSDDPSLSWSDQGIERGDALATPSIRLHDVAAGTDEVLERGAFSLAWRSDGAFAYFKGADRDYRAGIPYVGSVVVRASLRGRPQIWSPEQARYVVVAWAGDRLVAYREREGEALDVVVFDGPEQMRVLARDSALVALSPDGRRAFLERGPAAGRPAVRVVGIADGRTLAALDLTTIDPSVGAVAYSGDWRGDRVIASSASGLALFRVGPGSVELDQALAVAGEPALAEPRFAGPGPDRAIAWRSGPDGALFLDCDLSARTCARAVPLPAARGIDGFPTWRRPLYNPSRPQ